MKKNEAINFLNELSQTDNILHISHNDLDGYASTYILNKYLDSRVSTLNQGNTNYGEIISKIDDMLIFKDTTVIITDLNLTLEECEFLDSNVKSWIVIDHHKTGIDSFEAYPRNYYLDWENCATQLLYTLFDESRYTSDKDLFRLAEIVDTYDLWKKFKGVDFNYGMLLSLYIYNNPFEVPELKLGYSNWILDKVFDYLISYGISNTELIYPKLFAEQIAVVNTEDFITDNNLPMSIKTALMHVKHLDAYIIYEDNDVAVFTGITTKVTQYAFDKMFDKKHYQNKVLINFNPENGNTAFRSRNERSSIYAQLCGGGGHPNASGARLKEIPDETLTQTLLKILKDEYIRNGK